MNGQMPQYLLLCEVPRSERSGRWRFVLRPLDGAKQVEVSDHEPDVWGERLELLTVLRALESLDQPSRVSLVGCGRYVEQGIQYGVTEWRASQWRWECFGQMTPVRDSDLWQRMEQVLHFHRVDCRRLRFDAGHGSLEGPHWNRAKCHIGRKDGIFGGDRVKCLFRSLTSSCAPWVYLALNWWQKVGVIRRPWPNVGRSWSAKLANLHSLTPDP